MGKNQKAHKKMHHSFSLLALLFIFSWSFFGSDSSGLLYQYQNNIAPPAVQSYQGPLLAFYAAPYPQAAYSAAPAGQLAVQIPAPAARYEQPATRIALAASVIDWGWGPIFVDPAAAPAWIDFFHNRDYNRYFGRSETSPRSQKALLSADFGRPQQATSNAAVQAAANRGSTAERITSIVVAPKKRTIRTVYTTF